MKLLLAILSIAAAAATWRRRKTLEDRKRERGSYPYHNGPFA